MRKFKDAYNGRTYRELSKYEKIWCDLAEVKSDSKWSLGLTLKDIPDDYEDVVSYLYNYNLLNRSKAGWLTERNIRIFQYRYDDNLSYREISKLVGLSIARVRDITGRFIRAMRYNGAVPVDALLEKGIKGCEKENLISVIRENDEIKEIFRVKSKEPVEERSWAQERASLGGLSARSYKCLVVHGINSLDKLKNVTDEELLSIRGLGTKSFLEIKEYIKANS